MPPLVLSDYEVQQLQALAKSRSLPHSIVQRAQIVLACGAGETNTAIAKRMGLTGMTVRKWRKRYLELGLEGLHDELRPGPGLIQSVSQALLPGLRAWVEVGGIAPSQCPKAFLPQPISI